MIGMKEVSRSVDVDGQAVVGEVDVWGHCQGSLGVTSDLVVEVGEVGFLWLDSVDYCQSLRDGAV